MLRTDVLARLLVERLHSLGPMSEAAAIDALEWRAPGRGEEVIRWAKHRGLIRHIAGTDDEPAMLEAARRTALARELTWGGGFRS